MKINLNADLGESFAAWKMGEDEALLQVVRSANIACGFHAGDPLVMRNTVRTALAAGVSLGAHPAYPDLQGFGRRPMKMAPAELEAAVIYQVAPDDDPTRTRPGAELRRDAGEHHRIEPPPHDPAGARDGEDQPVQRRSRAGPRQFTEMTARFRSNNPTEPPLDSPPFAGSVRATPAPTAPAHTTS